MTGTVAVFGSDKLSIPISIVLLSEDRIHPVMLIAGHILIEDSTASLLRTTTF